jgi:hypothetical protein
MGLAGGAYWHQRATAPAEPSHQQPAGRTLAEGTQRVLKQLDAPMAIRFYALLDANPPASLQQLADRASQLLGLYEEASGGRVKVTRFMTRSDDAEAAALADGLRAFYLGQGNACYLGITVVNQDRKEAVPVAPEWEPAMEADLSRALARISQPKPARGVPLAAPAPDHAAIDAVKQALPDFASLTVAEGTRRLQAQALNAFTTAAQEMATQVQQAEQRFTQAQRDNGGTAQEAARVELQKVRYEQSEKLKGIALQTQALVKTLEQMKGP